MLERRYFPLVGMMKFREPFDDINPNLRISAIPRGIETTNELLNHLNLELYWRQTNFSMFKVIVPPTAGVLSGRNAEYAKFTYDLVLLDGRRFPDSGEIRLVPHNDRLVKVVIELRPDERTGKRSEFDPIMASLDLD